MEQYKSKFTRQEIENKIAELETGSNSGSQIISGTYEELRKLCKENKLISGQQYLLTDYEPIISDTSFITLSRDTMNKQYQIYLKAILPNKFDDHCYAIDQNNDTYELWYDLLLEDAINKYPNTIIEEKYAINYGYVNAEQTSNSKWYKLEFGYYWSGNTLLYDKVTNEFIGYFTLDKDTNKLYDADNNYWGLIESQQKVFSKGFIYRIIDKYNNDIYFDWYNILLIKAVIFSEEFNDSEYNKHRDALTIEQAPIILAGSCERSYYGENRERYYDNFYYRGFKVYDEDSSIAIKNVKIRRDINNDTVSGHIKKYLLNSWVAINRISSNYDLLNVNGNIYSCDNITLNNCKFTRIDNTREINLSGNFNTITDSWNIYGKTAGSDITITDFNFNYLTLEECSGLNITGKSQGYNDCPIIIKRGDYLQLNNNKLLDINIADYVPEKSNNGLTLVVKISPHDSEGNQKLITQIE